MTRRKNSSGYRPSSFEILEPRRLFSGITLITHGWGSNADGWVSGMANAIEARAASANTTVRQFEVTVGIPGLDGLGSMQIIASGPALPTVPLGEDEEIIVKLDWGDVDGGPVSTGAVASVFANHLLAPDRLSLFQNSPIHMIGHSRGASLNVSLAEWFNSKSIEIDHFTSLDPHPVDGVAGDDIVSFGDTPMNLPANVRFADNYFRGDLNPADFNGESVARAVNVQLTESVLDAPLGTDILPDFDPFNIDPGYSLEHSDVHLWYYGTIDTASSASNNGHAVPENWYSGAHPQRTRTGFAHSRIAALPGGGSGGGGTIASGQTVSGHILPGVTHTYTFGAQAGGGIVLAMGDSADVNGFEPQMRVYDPDGILLDETWHYDGASLRLTAQQSGTHYVVVGDLGANRGASYRLAVASLPGSQQSGVNGGTIASGQTRAALLRPGGLDVFTFDAVAGGGIVASMGDIADVNGLEPQLRLYGPDGALLEDTWGYDGASIRSTAQLTGTHYLVAGDLGANRGGHYNLAVASTPTAQAPGANGGAIGSGQTRSAVLPVGGLHVYTVGATAGAGLIVSMGDINDVNGLEPQLRVYGPDGALLEDRWGYDGASVHVTASLSGRHYIVAGDLGGNRGGQYNLAVAVAPGAQINGINGGAIATGQTRTATLPVGGLDVYTFGTAAGRDISVALADIVDVPGFEPQIRLFGPDGELLADSWGYESVSRSATARLSGTHYLVVGDLGGNRGGQYRLTPTFVGGPRSDTTNDFTGDALPDLLWRNRVTGQNAVWGMDGTTRATSALLPTTVDLNWTIGGSADFNFDGKTDVLWRNDSTGQNALWLMDGTARLSSVMLPTTLDVNWRMAGAADFNADGSPDILWRNNLTGQNAIWLMSGTTRSSSTLLPVTVDLNWRMAGAADFNGDAHPDILWRNNATGQNAVWLMNGTTRLRGSLLASTVDLNWRMCGSGDLNGDGHADILWRNVVTGQNAVWFMNGAERVSSSLLQSTVDQNWELTIA